MEKLVGDLMGSIISIGGKKKRCNIVALLTNKETGEKRAYPGANIVTNDGDLYYAQMAAGETPTTDFSIGGMRLGTGSTAVQKTDTDVETEDTAGRKLFSVDDSAYPQTDDQDADNTGAGTDIVTWRISYGTTEANITGITEMAIVDNPASATKALSHALIASFDKTASDTLKIFVNHEFAGA